MKQGNHPISLHSLVKDKKENLLITVLQQNPAIDSKDEKGLTALHYAALLGYAECCLALIQNDANLHIKTREGETVLHLAVKNQHFNIIDILLTKTDKLKRSILIDLADDNGRTALHLGVQYNEIRFAQILLEHGANINSINEHGYSPLHFAAMAGHVAMVKYLLERGCDPNQLTVDNETAEQIAQRYQKLSAAAYIISYKRFTETSEINFESFQQLILAELYYQHQQVESSASIYQQVVKNYPDTSISHHHLAKFYHANRQFDLAEKEYQVSWQLLPDHTLACNYATLFYQNKKYAEALTLVLPVEKFQDTIITYSNIDNHILDDNLKKELQQNGKLSLKANILATYLVIFCQYAQGQIVEANQSLALLRDLVAKNGEAIDYALLGYCYKKFADFAKAAVCFEKAIQLQSNYQSAKSNLLACLAEPTCLQSPTLEIASLRYLELKQVGEQEAQKQNINACLKHYQAAYEQAAKLEAIPAQVECLQQIAALYLEQEKFDLAAKHFMLAFALYESNFEQLKVSSSELMQKDPLRLFYSDVTLKDYKVKLQQQYLHIELAFSKAKLKKNAPILEATNNANQSLWDYREQLTVLRKQVKDELATNKADPATILSNFTSSIKELIGKLVQECIQQLGTPPCEFAIVPLGSMGRDEANPCSDFEFAILIQKNPEKSKENDKQKTKKIDPDNQYLSYFRLLSELLELKLISFGETPLGKADKIIKPGLCLDDGGTTPLGAKMAYGFELIMTPKQLAALHDDTYLNNSLYNTLLTSLRTVGFIRGSKNGDKLVSKYQEKLARRLNKKIDKADLGLETVRQQQALIFFYETITGMYEPRLDKEDSEKYVFNIKNKLYRLVNHIIAGLALYYDIREQNSVRRIQALYDRGHINEAVKDNLIRVFNDVMRLRALAHLYYGYEKEDVIHNTASKDAALAQGTQYFQLQGRNSEILFTIYQTLLPLHRAAKLFYESKNREHIFKEAILFDNDLTTQGRVFEQLCQYDKALQCYQGQLAIFAGSPELHNNIGRIYATLGQYKEAKRHLEQAIKLAKDTGNYDKNLLAHYINDLGEVYSSINDLEAAVTCFAEALSLYRELPEHNNKYIAACINNLGNIYTAQGKYWAARQHYTEALQINQAAYGENHVSNKPILINIARMHQYLREAKVAIKLYQDVLNLNDPSQQYNHPLQATAFAYLGSALMDLNLFQLAQTALESAYAIDSRIYDKKHPIIARDFINLGIFWRGQNLYYEAKIKYFEPALNLLLATYGENHLEIADCYFEMGKANSVEAQNYLPKALEIYEHVYREQPHPKIAHCLLQLGLVWLFSNSDDKALNCLTRALTMFDDKQIHDQPFIAHANFYLGQLFEKSYKLAEAKQYYERARELLQQLIGIQQQDVTAQDITQVEERLVNLQERLALLRGDILVSPVQQSINPPASRNVQISEEWTPLHDQALWDDEAFARLLAARKNLNARNPHFLGQTLLHNTASGGQKDKVEKLIRAKVNINAQSDSNSTPLHEAASNGHDVVLDILLREGADIHATEKYNNATALLQAIMYGHTKCALRLLKVPGINTNARAANGWTPLYAAAYKDLHEVVKALIQVGVDINYIDLRNEDKLFNGMLIYTGEAAIHAAASNGHEAVMALFIKHDADLRQANQFGETPLHLAAQRGYEKVVLQLLQAGVDPAIKNSLYFYTPLLLAAENDQNINIVKILVAAKPAAIDSCHQNGATALHRAAICGSEAVAEFLVQSNASITAKSDGRLPIHCAAGQPNEKILALLLEAHKETEVKDSWEETPLHYAARAGQVKHIRYLHERRANVNARNIYGTTPLHLAAGAGHEEAVKILVSLGADITAVVNNTHNTALEYAISGGYQAIIEFLKAEKIKRSASIKTINKPELAPSLQVTFKNINECQSAFNESFQQANQLFFLENQTTQNSTVASFPKSAREQHGWTALHQMVVEGNDTEAKRLLLQGASPHNILENGIGVAHIAVCKRNTTMLQLLLQHSKTVANNRMLNNWQPLHWAAFYDLAEIGELLINYDANINATISMGWTPLHIAAFRGSINMVNLLLRKNANKNAKDGVGATPIFWSLQRKFTAIAEILLVNKADLQIIAKDGTSVLHWAAKAESPDLIQSIIAETSKLINVADASKSTPLHYAVRAGDPKTVELLLQAGADPNVQDGLGYTALHSSVPASNELIVKLLLEKGADPFQKDMFGNTALHNAAFTNDYADMVSVLLSQRPTILETTNNQGATALHLAAEQGNLEAVKILLKYNAPVNAQDAYYARTPLFCVCNPMNCQLTEQHIKIAELLLLKEHGADANLTTLNDDTPLHVAVGSQKPNDAIIKLLIEHTNINAKNRSGYTPLHLIVMSIVQWPPATKRIQKETIELLLVKGADVSLIDNKGFTAADHAKQRKLKDIEQLLMEALNNNKAIKVAEEVIQIVPPVATAIKAIESPKVAIIAVEKNDSPAVTLIEEPSGLNNIVINHAQEPFVTQAFISEKPMMEMPAEDQSSEYLPEPQLEEDLFNQMVAPESVISYTLAALGESDERSTMESESLITTVSYANYQEPQLYTDIRYGIQTKQPALVCAALEKLEQKNLNVAVIINQLDYDGTSLLEQTVNNENLIISEALLKHRANSEHYNSKGLTVLHLACIAGAEMQINLFLQYGAKLTEPDQNGKTALHYLCLHGHVKILTDLLTNQPGARHNVLSVVDANGQGLLHSAALSQNLALVEYLIAQDLDIHTQDSLGFTPLQLAAARYRFTNEASYLAIIKTLLQHGSNINYQNDELQVLSDVDEKIELLMAATNKAEEYVKSAVDAFFANEPATYYYEQALQQTPWDGYILLDLARCYYIEASQTNNQQLMDKAAKAYKAACYLANNEAYFNTQYAHFLSNQNRWKDTICYLEKIDYFAFDITEISFSENAKYILMGELQDELMVADFKSLSIKTNVMAAYLLISTYQKQQQIEKAEKFIQRFYEMVNDYPTDIHYALLAYAYKMLGKYEQAVDSFDKAIQQRDNYELAVCNKNICLLLAEGNNIDEEQLKLQAIVEGCAQKQTFNFADMLDMPLLLDDVTDKKPIDEYPAKIAEQVVQSPATFFTKLNKVRTNISQAKHSSTTIKDRLTNAYFLTGNLQEKIVKLEMQPVEMTLEECTSRLEELKQYIINSIDKWKYKTITVNANVLTITTMTATQASQLKDNLCVLGLNHAFNRSNEQLNQPGTTLTYR